MRQTGSERERERGGNMGEQSMENQFLPSSFAACHFQKRFNTQYSLRMLFFHKVEDEKWIYINRDVMRLMCFDSR